MPIQTSQITTEANGDLTINPAGTGKIVLTKMAGTDGERPLGAADADGNVHAFDHTQLTELPGGAIDNDLIMVQRQNAVTNATEYYSVDATLLGGLPLLDPPGDTTVSFSPAPQSGTGTQADPFVLQQVTCPAPGQSVQSVEICTVTTTENVPAFLPMYDVSEQPAKGRFDQGWKLVETGTVSFRFDYTDVPNTAKGDGQVYNGTIQMGTTTVYVKFPVLQIANLTAFDPVANASPPSVEIPSENLYGTGETDINGWADGTSTLSVTASGLGGTYDTDIEFSVNDGLMDGTPKGVSDGDVVKFIFKETSVAAASDGDTISGALTNNAGYFQPFSMVKNTQAHSFTIAPLVDQSLNTEVATGSGKATGINAPTTIDGVGSTADPLTSPKVSVAGATAVAATNVTYNPGDTVLAYGTTGGVVNTTYQATFTVGGASATWDVTTAAAAPTIVQPQITSPADNSENLTADVTLVGSAYTAADPLNPPGQHTTSTWEVYESEIAAQTKTSEIITSESLTTLWNPRVTKPPGSVVAGGIVYAQGKFVTAGQSGGAANLVSTDGITWRHGNYSESHALNAIAYGDGKFVATGNDGTYRIAYSDNGEDWGYVATNLPSWRGYGVAYGNNVWVAVSSNDNIATSTDAINWNIHQNATGDWRGVAFGNGVFVAVSYTGETAYSTDGINWTNPGASSQDWASIAFGNGKFVAVSYDNRVCMTSTDGSSWTVGSLPNYRWTGVAYGNGMFMIGDPFGGGGTATSTDGLVWTREAMPSNVNNLPGAFAYGAGLWVAVATQGNSYIVYSRSNNVRLTFTNDKAFNSVDDSEVGTIDQKFKAGSKVLASTDSNVTGILAEDADAVNKTMLLHSATGTWTAGPDAVSEVADILVPSPDSEPPDPAIYTAVTPSATTLTTATLDDNNINVLKAYHSRVKYADDSSTGSLVESEFSPYHRFTSKDGISWSGQGIGDAYISPPHTSPQFLLVPGGRQGDEYSFDGLTWFKKPRPSPENTGNMSFGKANELMYAEYSIVQTAPPSEISDWTMISSGNVFGDLNGGFGGGGFSPNGQKAIMSFNGRFMYASGDGGVSWSDKSGPIGGRGNRQYCSIMYLDNDRAIGVSLDRQNFITNDGGATLQPLFFNGTANLNSQSLAILSGQNLAICTDASSNAFKIPLGTPLVQADYSASLIDFNESSFSDPDWTWVAGNMSRIDYDPSTGKLWSCANLVNKQNSRQYTGMLLYSTDLGENWTYLYDTIDDPDIAEIKFYYFNGKMTVQNPWKGFGGINLPD